MSEFSPSRLHETLDRVLVNLQSRRLCVSLSGGLDSVVLLHALVQLRTVNDNWQLRAMHVNHQLQKDSGRWAQQCVDLCIQLNVPCKVLRVDVRDVKTQGLEAAARAARYAALEKALESDEVLLTAHHADDQLETILIALMRGAGLNGLAAMPAIERFEHAWHARPLLEFTRVQLQSWAMQQSLTFIDDPTNTRTQFNRNFLRAEVIPQLRQRWPSAAITATRSASHLGETLMLLREYATKDLSNAVANGALSIAILQTWSPQRRRAVIRQWLQNNEVLLPATRVMQALEHDMFNAAEDRIPCIRWDQYSIHRYRDHLHLEKQPRPEEITEVIEWNWKAPLSLPHQLGRLCMTSDASVAVPHASELNASKLPVTLSVRFRRGGEHIQLPGEFFHRELRKALQEAGVLPWWRGRIPLLYLGEKLVAVAGFWVDAEFAAIDGHPVMRLCWQHGETLQFADKPSRQ